MPEDILRKIRGEDLGRATMSLPPIETTEAETIEATFDAANVGRVRVTFRKFRKQHRRNRLLFWLAETAERVE